MNTLGENNSNSQKVNNLLTLLNSQYQNQFSNFQSAVIQPTSQNINLIQSQKYLIKNNQIFKNITNSSMTIPYSKKNINLTLNDKENDEEENTNTIFKEYSTINSKRNHEIDELKEINEKIKDNNTEIEEIKSQLKSIKAEKKQKQADIVNLLSNKESIEEIFKNKIYLLINPNINNLGKKEKDDKNMNDNNDKEDNNNEIEDNFKITLNDIKDSDQGKYIEQVNNMVDDIFIKKDNEINSKIVGGLSDKISEVPEKLKRVRIGKGRCLKPHKAGYKEQSRGHKTC